MSDLTEFKTLLTLLAGQGDQLALVAPDYPGLTYDQLQQSVINLADQLNRLGLGRGDRIAIAMPNGPEMILTFLAAAMCGTAAPLNPKYTPAEFAFYYGDTDADALITLGDTMAAAQAAATDEMKQIQAAFQPDGRLSFDQVGGKKQGSRAAELAESDDIAMILHTSGTTSQPKRVPIKHRNLAASAQNIIGTYQLSEGDRALCIMPLFHVHGLVASMLSTLASGGTVICPRGFNAIEFWRLLSTFKPTWYSAVPTMHQLLLARASRNQDAIQTSPLRFIRSSSSSLPPIVLESLEAAFKAPVLEAYSMSEASHQMTSNPLPPSAHKAGSVGYGFGVEVGVMEEEGDRLLEPGQLGEIVVKGPNVFDGYENNPAANAKAFANGWFRTGDQGLVDSEGYLSLTGRLKELINRGGEKISPLEVDNVLLRHPAVAQVLTFGAPHKTLGEDIHTALVLKDATVSEQDLRKYCSEQLAAFKVPRQFHRLDELPRGATGKLQRLKMAEILGIKDN